MLLPSAQRQASADLREIRLTESTIKIPFAQGNRTPTRTPSPIGARTPIRLQAKRQPAEVVRPVQMELSRSPSPIGARTPIRLQADTQPAEMQPVEVIRPQSVEVVRPQPVEVVRPAQTQVIRPVEGLCDVEPMTQTHQATPTGDVDVVYSDAFVTKDEFLTSLAKERDIYCASVQLILQQQVAKLQETMTLEVNKLNVRIEEIANAQESDIVVRMDQKSAHVEKYASLQELMSTTMASIPVLSAEVSGLKDKLANVQHSDISSKILAQVNARMDQTEARVEKNVNDILQLDSILHLFNERTDQMSMRMEKVANDFETSFHQTEARVETSANDILKLAASLDSMAGQQEKSMGDIREMAGAVELILNQLEPNGARLRQARRITSTGEKLLKAM